jgi:hypothetical protein
MTPRRAGWISGSIAAVGFLIVSELLLVRPGHPIAERTDVFFQSDAGGLIQDAVLDRDFRARGTHPLVYPLWTRPLHALARWLAPVIDPATTATYASRLLVALAAGAGIGALAQALAARGLPPGRSIAFALLAVAANGHALAAIPDHFGLSVGVIAFAFATLLANRSLRFKFVVLALLAPIGFGITVTNVFLPLGLIAVLIVHHYRNAIRRWHVAAAILAIVALGFAIREIAATPSIQARVRERVSLYLNLRLIDHPLAALGYSVRGLSDVAVAPTPIVLRNNLDQLPMLTYERETGPRPFWPHDGVQTAGALVWLGLLGWGLRTGWNDPTVRPAVLGALGWVAGNAAFHNIWGDEYFLYSPHYALPLMMIAAIGFRSLQARVFYPSLAVVVGAALHTLRHYQTLLYGILE